MKMIPIFLLFSILFSCEEAIDFEIDDFEERNVIEADFRIYRDSSYSSSRTNLRRTTVYFNDQYDNIENAQLSVRDLDTDSIFISKYYLNRYIIPDLLLKENVVYELLVEIDGMIYKSTSKSVDHVPIDSIEYMGDTFINGEELAEFRIAFKDNANVENFYLFTVDYRNIQVYSDEYFNGQNFNLTLYKRKSEIYDNRVIIESVGINKEYYNYLKKVIELDYPQFYGPFSTPPPLPLGNIVNMTKPRNYAFGYFNISVSYVYRFALE